MKSRTAAIISVVVLFAILFSGFAPIITATNVKRTPYPSSETISVPQPLVQTTSYLSTYVSTYSSYSSTTVTQTTQILDVGSFNLSCGTYYAQPEWVAGEAIQLNFSAAKPIYFYLFNATEFAAFTSNHSNTSPNEEEFDNQTSVSASFGVSESSSVSYLVLYQKPGPSGCVGRPNALVYYATASAAYTMGEGGLVPYSSTYSSYTLVTTTTTSYSLSTYVTTLTNTSTKTCQLGWLEYVFLGCR